MGTFRVGLGEPMGSRSCLSQARACSQKNPSGMLVELTKQGLQCFVYSEGTVFKTESDGGEIFRAKQVASSFKM